MKLEESMSYADREYFRKLGIAVLEPEPEPAPPSDTKPGMYRSYRAYYLFVSWLLFWLVLGGTALYGLLLLAAWGLRLLGVKITGI